jgi:hypothetical protein
VGDEVKLSQEISDIGASDVEASSDENPAGMKRSALSMKIFVRILLYF